MSRANGTREAWHPQNTQDNDAVLRELHEILASPHFCNSKRYPALLKYIVENTLAGKSDLLKERTIGVEVFDRPPTFDTNSDTVVRYTAGEVRKRLLLYYSESDRNSGIRISLPAGSYIPEFMHEHEGHAEHGDHAGFRDAPTPDADDLAHAGVDAPEAESTSVAEAELSASPSIARGKAIRARLLWLALGATVLIGLVVGLRWQYGAIHPQSAVDDFWGPVLHEQRMVVVCIGGVVFQQNNFSGVITAGKDIEYPFVSMQIASAIAQVSGVLEHSGATTKLLSSPSTPLTELREHPIILLGGYNNQWAMRLLQAQPIQFTPEPVESIIDGTKPQAQWVRDKSLPYSSADDYALIARFRDSTTDSWVVVLAGLGRNGTEAAAQFVTSPHYMQLLRDQAGMEFSNRNVEAVLKVSVIDGKTGAPSIQTVHVW
ncbi:MAG: hypothetical protein P4K86_05640 [Terracidiphilus sp.]|nr:hypothetical protein [Terracidiphilus sp.]MDR3775678.1 hypothetical protein [Terracidiphilus sp.]